MSTGFGYLDEIDEALELLSERRVYGGELRKNGKWFHVTCNTSDVEVLRKIHELTSGRLMIGMASVTMENEQDAVTLKLLF